MLRRAISLATVALLAGCASAASPGASQGAAPARDSHSALRQFLDTLVDAPEFRSAHWGILVVDPTRAETLYARNADKLFMPASNMKLLTGTTALVQLGANYRWSTSVLTRGVVKDSTFSGLMIVKGNGDPSMSAHMRKGDALAPMRAMADSLRAHGIAHVRGALVAAPSPFVDSPLGYGWAWSDLDDSYSAGVDALYFNEGFTEVVVRGGAHAGDPVQATTRPATTYPHLIVTARTVDALRPASRSEDSAAAHGIIVSQDSSRNGVLVAGTIAAGDSMVVEITFRRQAEAYLAALSEAFAARGITVENGPVASDGADRTLFTMLSPTLGEVLPYFEKPSQNQIGEILFKTLALEKTGVGRADSAARVVERQMIAWGAAPDGFAVRDGSGLSRHDYVSPRTLVRVLNAIRLHPDFKLFYDAMPIAGVDGTIRNRMKGTAAEGNVHAKTGTLDKARSLSGYVTTADGRLLIVSALCNNYVTPTRRVDRVTDALGAYLASMRMSP